MCTPWIHQQKKKEKQRPGANASPCQSVWSIHAMRDCYGNAIFFIFYFFHRGKTLFIISACLMRPGINGAAKLTRSFTTSDVVYLVGWNNFTCCQHSDWRQISICTHLVDFIPNNHPLNQQEQQRFNEATLHLWRTTSLVRTPNWAVTTTSLPPLTPTPKTMHPIS